MKKKQKLKKAKERFKKKKLTGGGRKPMSLDLDRLEYLNRIYEKYR